MREPKPFIAFVKVAACWLSDWWSKPMPELDKVQPEEDLLFAFAATIATALAMGLPMAVAIVLICS